MNFDNLLINIDLKFDFELFWTKFKIDFEKAKKKKTIIFDALNEISSTGFSKKFEFEFLNQFKEFTSTYTEAKSDINKNKSECLTDKLDKFFNEYYPDIYYDEIEQVNKHTPEQIEIDYEAMFYQMTNLNILGFGTTEKSILRYLKNPETTFFRHPIREYFEKLPKWNGTDYVQKFVDLFDIRENLSGINRREFIYEQTKKYFIRIVNQAIGKRSQLNINKCNLLLLSPRGSGKTGFITDELFTPFLYQKMLQGFNFKQDEQNNNEAMCSQLIIFIDEFDSFANKIHNMKEQALNGYKFYSGNSEFSNMIRQKKVTKKRTASFLMTSNPEKFGIYDDSLLNRFLVLDFKNSAEAKIPFHKWNYNESGEHCFDDTTQLWSQIYHLYYNGYSGVMSDAEDKLNKEINLIYTKHANIDIEHLFTKLITKGNSTKGENYTADELLKLINESSLSEDLKLKLNARNIGRYLKKYLKVQKIGDSSKSTNKAYKLIINFN